MSFQGALRSVRIFSLALSLLISAWRISRWERRAKAGHPEAKDRVSRIYGKMGVRVRTTALDLQGLMVKVGQFLSTRTDILPTVFTRELKSLQDAVPGVAFDQIRHIVESELGSHLDSNFSSFDETAIAAASLGQVHRATLVQGGTVAVKILRPGIEELAAVDLRALRLVVRFMQRFTKVGRRVQAVALYREFAHTVHQELDYRQEAQHLIRFQRQFSDRDDVVVPRVFDTYSSRRVLVMEFIEGIKITDLAAIEAQGIETNHIVDLVVDTYIEQVLVHGFIHVDPHPGNLLVMPDGRLCYLDFGMMSDIPQSEAVAFARLLLAAMVRDLDTVVKAIDELGFLQPHADRAFLKQAVGFIVDRISGIELRRGPELDDFLEEFQAFLRDEPLILQAKYMFLGRALGMVLGLVNTLNPNIQWGPLLRARGLPKLSRIVEEAAKSDRTSGAGWQNGIVQAIEAMFGDTAATASRVVLSQLQSAITSTVRLPQKVERVLDKLDRNELQIRLEMTDLYGRLERQQRRFARFIWFGAIILLTMLSLWLHEHTHPYLMWEAWILDALAVLRWLWLLRKVQPTLRRR